MDKAVQTNYLASEKSGWQRQPFSSAIALWLLICACLSNAGWILSAIHQLNFLGYICVLAVLSLLVAWWEKSRNFEEFKMNRWLRMKYRFKRPLPLAFLLLAALSCLGGFLYPPNNYDALAYRVPRVLHWLAEGRWHWVHSYFPRLNVRACGAEWLLAPQLAVGKSIRWAFIPSLISFMLLPGLCYSLFTRFGVKRKVAWYWMWISATGYGYVVQAGGIGNDLLGAVYALAAFDFALRARQSRKAPDFWLFLIASGLMTGGKASNLPLLLPLFFIAVPSWRVLLLEPAKSAAVIVFSGLASFLPTALFNFIYCHDWTGTSLEFESSRPLTQLLGNPVIWAINNLAPPIFPFSGTWNHILKRVFPPDSQFLDQLKLSEIQMEEGAGLGLGIILLLVVSFVASRTICKRTNCNGSGRTLGLYEKALAWSPYAALLAFAIMGGLTASAARLILPYYPMLIAPILVFGFHEQLLRSRWWKGLVACVLGLAFLLIVILPARPLWPAQLVMDKLRLSYPSSPLLKRAQTVYSVYAGRYDAFAPIIAILPQDATVLGFLTFDDPETSLWQPLGTRRIKHVTPSDTRQDLEAEGIKYVLVSAHSYALKIPFEELLRKYDAELVKTVPLILRASDGLTDWYLIKLKPTSTTVNQTATN